MFKKGGSSSRQKNVGCFSQHVLREYRKTPRHRGFTLKPIERPYVSLKNGARDF